MGWATGTSETEDRRIALYNALEAARGTSKEHAARKAFDAFMDGRCWGCLGKLDSCGHCAACYARGEIEMDDE